LRREEKHFLTLVQTLLKKKKTNSVFQKILQNMHCKTIDFRDFGDRSPNRADGNETLGAVQASFLLNSCEIGDKVQNLRYLCGHESGRFETKSG